MIRQMQQSGEVGEPDATVLVVDDDAMARRLVAKTLTRAGFQVVEAVNGQQALDIVVREMPDIILMDVEMPVMDGYAACLALRQRYADQPLPVLMVTASDDSESVNRAYEAGATDFTSKPISLPVLGHRVRYMLRSSRVMRELSKTVAALNRSRRMLAKAQKVARLGSWEIDLDDGRFRISESLAELVGLSTQDLDHSSDDLLALVHPDDRMRVSRWFRSIVADGEHESCRHRVVLPDGTTRILQQRVSLAESALSTQELIGSAQDVTREHEQEERDRRLAYSDGLTGLPNREAFMLRMGSVLDNSATPEAQFSAMFLDVDNFKRVNDTLGHRVGDMLLQAFTARLEQAIGREIVADSTCVQGISMARFGGDEFTILLGSLPPERAVKLAQDILNQLHQPLIVAGHELLVSSSIGIAHFPMHGQDADTLLKNADTAMYQAKRAGKNGFRVYENVMNAMSLDHLTMEHELRYAIDRDELYLEYQPQLDLASNAIVGVEALMRWHGERFGLVPPDTFIPLAENSDLINRLGEWVLRAAVTQMQRWLSEGHTMRSMAVNISVRQFMAAGFVELVAQVLEESGMPPANLELEITESLLMQDVEKAIEILNSLKALGVDLAIDDFGTGYSSLNYLKRFPIDRLKIDKAFIRDVATNADDAAITRAVVAMANSMNLAVVAEGVEDEAQLRFLRELDCSVIQGYYLSRPLPADRFDQFLSGKLAA